MAEKRNQGQLSIESLCCEKGQNVTVETEIHDQVATATEVASCPIPTEELSNQKKISWPDILTVEMWENKLKTYPWLICGSGKIGCKICSNATNLGLLKAHGLKVSREWSTTSVDFSGRSRSTQLSSLRKKCFIHAKSQFHIKAEKIFESAKDEDTPSGKNMLTTQHSK